MKCIKYFMNSIFSILLCFAFFQIASCQDSGKNDSDTGENGNPCEEIVCEGETPHCCNGECRECCEDMDCNDKNDCTLDSCNSGKCINQPVADMTSCSGGICCGGICRIGGQCCSNDDCVEGCKGNAIPCNEFTTESDCNAQKGCSWLGSSYCDGTVMCDNFEGYDHFKCFMCPICEYVSEAGKGCERKGEMLCSDITDPDICTIDCLCTWYPGAGCGGSAQPCSSFPNETFCHEQSGCYWNACVDYVCT